MMTKREKFKEHINKCYGQYLNTGRNVCVNNGLALADKCRLRAIRKWLFAVVGRLTFSGRSKRQLLLIPLCRSVI